jgi:CheY-like chemotaxis protein
VLVADSGTGIAPEHLPRLFEPFFTTKEVGKGTGLGLPMVHGFVRQSGGAVSIASMPGKGTAVSLFLPRAAAPARAEPARPLMPLPRGDGLRILLVEDDPEVREAMRCSLGDAGHRVLTAAEGSEAMAILRNGEDLDLLLCDLMLPGEHGGLDVADTARRCRPGLRILIASGYGADAPDGVGGYEMIAKPVSHAELLRRVAAEPTAAAA